VLAAFGRPEPEATPTEQTLPSCRSRSLPGQERDAENRLGARYFSALVAAARVMYCSDHEPLPCPSKAICAQGAAE
jgi:hypothetical protein